MRATPLKPYVRGCPVCGQPPEILDNRRTVLGTWDIRCHHRINHHSIRISEKTKAAAVAAWNRRRSA